jgi:prepilin-type N-terminal cleavage/methylation domain-containing protein
MNNRRGYTLVELVVAVGLFALVMLLASGAYLVMIGVNRQTQAIATGIDNLSFAVETMSRTIRTGSNYNCVFDGSGNCPNGGTTFSVKNASGATITYVLSSGAITQNGVALTDPSVNISSLLFYVYGTGKAPADYSQPHATIVVSGTVSSGPGKTEPFSIETGATMRGTDIKP